MTRRRAQTKPLLAVVDYEMGNLHSVAKALEKAGARIKVTSQPAAIRQADGVVLPGVGAFGEAMHRLRAKQLVRPIQALLKQNKPFLGICLGLQILFEGSDESPRIAGLGFFKGRVVKFRGRAGLKVPHMGWNTIQRKPQRSAVLKDIGDGSYFYFVHSFYPAPRDKGIVATETPYGKPFCSAVTQGRLFASQFHPEKSGEQGQRLLRNFVRSVAACS